MSPARIRPTARLFGICLKSSATSIPPPVALSKTRTSVSLARVMLERRSISAAGGPVTSSLVITTRRAAGTVLRECDMLSGWTELARLLRVDSVNVSLYIRFSSVLR